MEESRSGSVAQSQETSMFATEDEENALSETRVSGNVAGKTIILIHDVIDTGRLLKTAVEVSKYSHLPIPDGSFLFEIYILFISSIYFL